MVIIPERLQDLIDPFEAQVYFGEGPELVEAPLEFFRKALAILALIDGCQREVEEV